MQKITKVPKIKVILLGNRSVGKSSIIRRFVLDDFPLNIQPTVAVDYMSKTIQFNGNQYRLELWDTAGQEKYRSLVKGYLKGAHACLYVYDSKNINSYMDLVDWINLFQSTNSETHSSFIACNKCDIATDKDFQQLKKTKNLYRSTQRIMKDFQQFHCSAKTSQNIKQIFMKIVYKVVSQHSFNKKRSNKLIQQGSYNYLKVKCCEST